MFCGRPFCEKVGSARSQYQRNTQRFLSYSNYDIDVSITIQRKPNMLEDCVALALKVCGEIEW